MNNKIFDVPYIRGISTIVPKNRVIVEDLIRELSTELNFKESVLKNIMKLSGIQEIRKSSIDETMSVVRLKIYLKNYILINRKLMVLFLLHQFQIILHLVVVLFFMIV